MIASARAYRFVLLVLLVTLLLIPVPAGAQSSGPVVFGPDGGTHDMAWLHAHYGNGITWTPASGHHFELRAINIMTSGDTLIRLWVFQQNGQPAIGQPTTYSFPSTDLPLIDPAYKTLCSGRGVLNKNRVDGTGKVEYQIGSGSWIRGDSGPYTAWVLSPSITSDCLSGIGWLGGTNHEGPTELFFYEVDDTTPTPAPATATPIPATVTPGPSATPGPSPTPGTGDLSETNDLLRQILAAMQKLNTHLGAQP